MDLQEAEAKILEMVNWIGDEMVQELVAALAEPTTANQITVRGEVAVVERVRNLLPADLVPRLRRVLIRLQDATRPGDADAPGFRLHPLKGDRAGEWSVRVSGNWRVVFRFEGGEVVDVDLVDYH